MLKPPVVLDGGEMLRLKQVGRAESMSAKRGARPVAPTTAIVVLGEEPRTFGAWYGCQICPRTRPERLRFGIWLSRQTGLPGFQRRRGLVTNSLNGGVISEAEVAARVTQQHYGWPSVDRNPFSRRVRTPSSPSINWRQGVTKSCW